MTKENVLILKVDTVFKFRKQSHVDPREMEPCLGNYIHTLSIK